MPDAPASPPDPALRPFPSWLGTLGFSAAYIALAHGGLLLAGLHGNVSPVWPATGFAIWLLLSRGSRQWPAVALGAAATHLSTDIPVAAALAIAAGHTLEAWLGARVIRFGRQRWSRLGDLALPAAHFAAAGLAPVAGAGIGVGALLAAGAAGTAPAWELWSTWWAGNALGALFVAPLLRTLFDDDSATRPPPARRRGPAWLAGALALAVCAFVMFSPAGHAYVFAVFPLLLFAAWLHPAAGPLVLAAFVAAAALAAAAHGGGPFVGAHRNDALLRLQGFLAGVAVTALVLPIFQRSPRWRLPTAVLLAGWLLSGWGFVQLQRSVAAKERAALDAATVDASDLIERRMALYADALRSGVAFRLAHGEISHAEWRTFARELELPRRYPGIHGIGMVLPVAPSERTDYLARRRTDEVADFSIRAVPDVAPPPDAATHPAYVIHFVEPLARNRAALGLDLASEATRRTAADAARDSGEPRMTQRIMLVQDLEKRNGFLLFVPIYRPGSTPTDPAGRRAAHLGWIYAPFITAEFLEGAIGGRSRELALHFFEGRTVDPAALLYRSGPAGATPATFDEVTTVELAGQTFTLGWTTLPGFVSPGSFLPVLVALGLALLTLLLAGLFFSLGEFGARARQLAEARTAQLNAAKEELEAVGRWQRGVLESAAHGIFSFGSDGILTSFNRAAERLLGYAREETVGRLTPALFHDPAELQRHAAVLSAELDRPVAPGPAALGERAALGRAEERRWTWIRRDGTRFPVFLSITALRDPGGAISGFMGIAQDLTEQERTQEALRAAEERWSFALEGSSAGVWDWDALSNRFYFSRQWKAMIGYAENEIGDSVDEWKSRVHPGDLPDALAAMQRHYAGETPHYENQHRLRHRDGSWRWILDRGKVIAWLAPGKPRRVIGTHTDITELMHVRGELLDSRERLATIFSAVDEGLVLQGENGRILECNDSACRILGLTRAQLAGRDSLDPRWGTIHEDGSPCPGENQPAMIALRTGRPQREVVLGVHRPDGSLVWVRVTSSPIFETDGTVRRVVTSFVDITAQLHLERRLRQSEERLRLATGVAHVGIWDWDVRTGRISWDPQMFSLYGLPPGEDLTVDYSVWAEAVHPDQLAEQERIVRQVIRTGVPQPREFDIVVHGTGESRTIATVETVVRDARGEVIRMVGVNRDVSAEKRLLQELARTRDRALEASRLKSEFLATMSHEIRTPMNAIVGMSSALADSRLDPEQRGMSRVILEGAEALLTLIDDILDFSKIEAGRLRLDPIDFAPAAVVTQVLELLRPRVREKNLHLVSRLDPAVSGRFRGDAGRLRQVLLNLVGNAVKFTAHGEVAVAVRLSGADPARPVLQVEVSDTGIGIPDAVRPRLFQPFTQADSSTTRRYGGSGLGLAISRQLVELMGGSIGFDSRPGAGSTFRFEVPLEPAATADDPPPTPRGFSPSRAHLKLLVAEDNPANQLVASSLLRKLGFELTLAADGEAALRALAAGTYDAVLMDCQMPVLDGYEATRRIRRGEVPGVDPAIPIIAVTAYAQPEDRDKCLAAGMDAYVTKPIRPAELGAALLQCSLVLHNESSPVADPVPPVGPTPPAVPAPSAASAPSDPASSAAKLFDPTVVAALRRLPAADGRTVLEQVVALLHSEIPARLALLSRHLEATSHGELAAVAHLIAGSAANLGADELRSAALALEAAARTGDRAAMTVRLESLHAAWHRLQPALDSLLPSASLP